MHFPLDPHASTIFVLVYTWLQSYGIAQLGTMALKPGADGGLVPVPATRAKAIIWWMVGRMRCSGVGRKKTQGASGMAQRMWVPMHEADSTVTATELVYEVADLGWLLTMTIKAQNKDMARKEDAVVDLDLATGKQKRVIEIKHKSASLVWDSFAAHRLTIRALGWRQRVHPAGDPAVRRREESVAYIFEMLAEQRRGAVGIPPSESGEGRKSCCLSSSLLPMALGHHHGHCHCDNKENISKKYKEEQQRKRKHKRENEKDGP
ncbi:hypothetical protein FIBSPDRAFT_904611 [Athelia psychrophila]|uniref:Uncharacterized protein n=1 Tax=Athelia psychrophila TaxID=1759441 RepID=A0A167UIB6_9AGAM|nr:hypothetical protein FIBSPDRAFT_904611 [Fibularhizoctonia sp. CBS 109695]